MDRRSLIKIAIAAALAGLVAWIYASGAYERFDPVSMRTWFRAAGPWGGVVFIVTYSILQPLGVNGLVFLLSAPLIWTPAEAFVLNWAGTVGTGLFSFFGARLAAREWIQQRLPRWIRRFDDRLYTRGFRTVLLLRLIFYTAPSVQWALGVSRVRFAPFLSATVVGVVPFTLLATLLGARAAAWIEEHPVATWPWDRIWPFIILATVVVVAMSIFIVRKWRANTID